MGDRRRRWVRPLRRAGSLVALAAAWEAYAVWADNRLTPRLGAIVEAIGEDIASGDLWFHARLTLLRGATGLAIAAVAGVAVGFAMARSRLVDAALGPLLSATYPVPKLALYPVFILMLGLGGASKVTLVALECFYPIAYNAYAGARSVDERLRWLARNVGAGRLRTLRDVTFPAALPSIMTGLRIATPLMLVVIVVTELIGESRGLGFMISDARANFRAAGVFGVVVVLAVLGYLLDRLVVLLTRLTVFWEKEARL